MRRCKEEIISQQDIIESKKSRGRQSVPAQSQASAGCAAAQNVRSPEFVPASVFRECPDTPIACTICLHNMLDPKSSMLKNVLFSGSYQSYNERVIGLSKHCLS